MAAEELLYSAIVDFETQGVSDAINDAERIEKAISGLDATVDVGVTVDESELDFATRAVSDMDGARPKVTPEVDDKELQDAKGIVDYLKDFAVGGTVAGIATGGVGLLLGASGVGGLLEIDDALASIEGRTGRMIPGAEQLISDLYTNGWGESRQQIADTIVSATNLGIAQDDLAEATEAAFQVASISGYDTSEVLRSMDSLVKNGLAPNFSSAADIITVGLQNGGDRGQDLLDTLNEYGTTFSELGISGEEALSIITSGTQAGIDNSDRLADAVRETGIRLSEIGTDENIANAFTQLDSLSDVDLQGLFDAYQAGTISGGEFFNGFFTALSDANAVDPQAAQGLANTLVGTQAEDFGIGALSQISTTLFGDIEGAAETAGNAVSNTLSQKIDLAVRNINQSIVDWLASDAINLDDFLANLETGINDAIVVLQNGGSIEDAISVGLKPLGFDDEFQKLESIFGSLIINFLEVVASVQDLLGKDSSATRAEVTRLGTQQLEFDLQLQNPEDIAAALEAANARGVDNETVSQLVNNAVSAAIDQGNFDQAQTIIGGLGNASLALEANGNAGNAAAETAGRILGGATDEDGNVVVPLAFGVDPAELQSQLAEAQTVAAEAQAAVANFNPNPGGDAGGFFTAVQEEGDAALSYWEQLQQTAVDAVTNTNTSVDSMATTAQEADTAIATALTGNTVTASFEEVARVVEQTMLESAAYIELFGRQVEEIDDKIASLLANMAAGFTSLSGTIAGAVTNFGAATASTQTLNVNQTFNTTSDAQAAAAGTMTLDGLRGF